MVVRLGARVPPEKGHRAGGLPRAYAGGCSAGLIRRGHHRAKSKGNCVFCLLTQPMGASLHPHVGAEKVLGIKAKASWMKRKAGGFRYTVTNAHTCLLMEPLKPRDSQNEREQKGKSSGHPPRMGRGLHTPPGKALPTPESSAETGTGSDEPHGLKHITCNMLSSC